MLGLPNVETYIHKDQFHFNAATKTEIESIRGLGRRVELIKDHARTFSGLSDVPRITGELGAERRAFFMHFLLSPKQIIGPAGVTALTLEHNVLQVAPSSL